MLPDAQFSTDALFEFELEPHAASAAVARAATEAAATVWLSFTWVLPIGFTSGNLCD